MERPAKSLVPPEVLEQIRDTIGSMRYGIVQLKVHDARVVQIEKVETVRIAPSAHLPPPSQHDEGTGGSPNHNPDQPTRAREAHGHLRLED